MTIRLSARAGGGSKAPLGRLVSANTTVTVGDIGSVISVDTSGGAVTLTMPGTPSINDSYYILDARANWGVNPVTLSSALYYGTTQTFTLDISGGLIVATWRGAPTGWTIGNDNPALDNTQLNTFMSLLATIANPSFTGVPNAPTASRGTSSTQIATTAFVADTVSSWTGPAIGRTISTATGTIVGTDKGTAIAVDTTANGVVLTLPSTGQVVGDTYNFLDVKANWGAVPATLASATFYGTVQTVSLDTVGDLISVTWRGMPIGWTVGSGTATFDSTTLNTLFSLKAALASPDFTGVPTAPTAAVGTNTTQIATTAFVQAATGPSISRTTSAATDTVTTADKNTAVAVDTTTNATVLTLPSTGLTVGDTYHFLDAKLNWGVNPASLASATFFGTAQTVSLDTAGGVATAVWRGLPIGWTVGSGTATFDNTTLNALFETATSAAGLPVSRSTAAATDTVTTADKNKLIAVDTTTNATVLTLPSTGLTVGDRYSFLDAKNNWGVNPASLASATFYGTAQTVSLDSAGNVITAMWQGLPIGWTVSSGYAKFDSATLNTLFSVKAALASPTFTGVPTAPTAAVGTNTEQVATTAYVQGEVSAINDKSAMVATATGLSANTTLTSAYKGKLTPIDTSAGAVQITLPASGNVLNDTYGFYDPKGTWSTNNVTFVVGTVHSQASTLIGDLSNVGVYLKYINATIGWIRV